jgi:2-polyprenyl-6-hydroxyphenyl methylase/3-demethylubiquinone-9 3-methyltransferase
MESQAIRGAVNNDVYRSLGERWYEADDDPIALLRALSRLHVPWIAEHLDRAFGRPSRVLDVGCGAGIGANALALRGHDVCGVDLAGPALEVAARHDTTGRVRWIEADARALPFADDAFDAVTAMDFLEHVDAPERVVAECARVLAPGGLFFFHTFDRNLLSWLVVIKGVEWFVRNVPRDMHVLRCFIRPAELRGIFARQGLEERELVGCAPRLSKAFLRMLATGRVPRELAFRFTRRTAAGYSGFAVKKRRGAHAPCSDGEQPR